MKKQKEGIEEFVNEDNVMLDDIQLEEELPITEMVPATTGRKTKTISAKPVDIQPILVNCLRNERVEIKFVPKENSRITNPKHVLSGDMADSAMITYVVPRLSSGMYVNILTDAEKAYLEHIMGLEHNALSIYKKTDNFWDDSNDLGISKVTLMKYANYLNLADPEDYIRYKILLANKDFVAPSYEALEMFPKATYKFVIVEQGAETKKSLDQVSIKKKCYKEWGKIEDDFYTLKTVVELFDGRPVASNTDISFLQSKVDSYITENSRLFYAIITDVLLPTKVLIKKAVEKNLITVRNNMYYLKDGNIPLCEENTDSTFENAALYISSPKRQDLKYSLEAKTK